MKHRVALKRSTLDQCPSETLGETCCHKAVGVVEVDLWLLAKVIVKRRRRSKYVEVTKPVSTSNVEGAYGFAIQKLSRQLRTGTAELGDCLQE